MKKYFFFVSFSTVLITSLVFPVLAGEPQNVLRNLPSATEIKEIFDRPLPKPPSFLFQVNEWIKDAWKSLMNTLSNPDPREIWGSMDRFARILFIRIVDSFRDGFVFFKKVFDIFEATKPKSNP